MASFLSVAINVLCMAVLWFPSTEQNVEMQSYEEYCLKTQPVTSSPSEEKPLTCKALTSPSPARKPSTHLQPTSQPLTIQSSVSQPFTHDQPTTGRPLPVRKPSGIQSGGVLGCECPATPVQPHSRFPDSYSISPIKNFLIKPPNQHCKTFIIQTILLNGANLCQAVNPADKMNFQLLMANIKLTKKSLGEIQGCRCIQGRVISVKDQITSLHFVFPSWACSNIEIFATLKNRSSNFCVNTNIPEVRGFIQRMNMFGWRTMR